MLKHWQIIFIIFIFQVSSSLYAQSSIKVFQTQQPAQALIPTLAPLFGQEAKLTARNNSLIVKASDSTLKEIEQLLNQLDKPLQNLLIEVKSSLDGNENYQQHSVEGRIKVGSDGEIRSQAPEQDSPTTTIRYKKDGTVVKTTHTRRTSTRSSPDTFRVRALEGNWAYIQIGQKVPFYTGDNPYPYRPGYPGRWQRSVQLEDVTSGFDVYPILNGDEVTIKVRPHNSSMDRTNPDRINTRSVNTMVTGKLGQWIYLGGAINQINENSGGYTHSTKRFSELNTNYRIKVTTID